MNNSTTYEKIVKVKGISEFFKRRFEKRNLSQEYAQLIIEQRGVKLEWELSFRQDSLRKIKFNIF